MNDSSTSWFHDDSCNVFHNCPQEIFATDILRRLPLSQVITGLAASQPVTFERRASIFNAFIIHDREHFVNFYPAFCAVFLRRFVKERGKQHREPPLRKDVAKYGSDTRDEDPRFLL